MRVWCFFFSFSITVARQIFFYAARRNLIRREQWKYPEWDIKNQKNVAWENLLILSGDTTDSWLFLGYRNHQGF